MFGEAVVVSFLWSLFAVNMPCFVIVPIHVDALSAARMINCYSSTDTMMAIFVRKLISELQMWLCAAKHTLHASLLSAGAHQADCSAIVFRL